ncbi:MAG: leucyl/phenylalanyl-tRNA--protein transferase, partial [Planctomycetota bacterium]
MKLRRDIPPDLAPRALVAAYASGAFPMPHPDDESRILWFSPDPRALLPLDERFHVSRRLQRTIRQGRFVCTVNRAFAEVMAGCARRPEGTWISPQFLTAYTYLHELGVAHSVEAWPAGQEGDPAGVAGGIYGVAAGGAFFAESMFHRVTDAGKVALVRLVEHLRRRGFVLCDVQWPTPHLRRFGAFDVSRADYLSLLAEALAAPVSFEGAVDVADPQQLGVRLVGPGVPDQQLRVPHAQPGVHGVEANGLAGHVRGGGRGAQRPAEQVGVQGGAGSRQGCLGRGQGGRERHRGGFRRMGHQEPGQIGRGQAVQPVGVHGGGQRLARLRAAAAGQVPRGGANQRRPAVDGPDQQRPGRCHPRQGARHEHPPHGPGRPERPTPAGRTRQGAGGDPEDRGRPRGPQSEGHQVVHGEARQPAAQDDPGPASAEPVGLERFARPQAQGQQGRDGQSDQNALHQQDESRVGRSDHDRPHHRNRQRRQGDQESGPGPARGLVDPAGGGAGHRHEDPHQQGQVDRR